MQNNLPTDRIFVNTPMEADLVERLDRMVTKKESTRAQTIRLLVRAAVDEFEHLESLKTRVVTPTLGKIRTVSK